MFLMGAGPPSLATETRTPDLADSKVGAVEVERKSVPLAE
jgi:hypothetical protein